MAVGAAAAAGAAGWALQHEQIEKSTPPGGSETRGAALPQSDRRPGITLPEVPQRHILVLVVAFDDADAHTLRDRVRDMLADLPAQPDDAGEVTVTVGFATAHAAELWPTRAAAAIELPSLRNDDDLIIRGGDIAVQVCAETSAAVRHTSVAVLTALGNPRVHWEQAGYRDAPTPDGTARTSSGFIDGIINPRSSEALGAGVWVDTATRDTYWVARRMKISSGFQRLQRNEQERSIGRYRDTGAPLSGGTRQAEVDLLAKQPDGTLLTPRDAHARRAHPSHIGRALMLRRSYSIDLEADAGLLFIAFMSDPMTFVLTQRRLDELDAFISHTRTTASGVFFVPGEL